ncbi:hypothetical protein B0H10DRAFT_2235479 [Mycena sp. CBHHK59/15]|nr:hypothetical protein B0H10DRAFT_2235479 [Mycena sp. CBHHK59/15]
MAEERTGYESRPALTKFTPGHDTRIQVAVSDTNTTTLDISFEFNTVMDCTSVTNSMSFVLSSSNKASGNPLDLLAQSIHLECARVRLCRVSVPGSATPPVFSKAPAVQDAQPNAAVKLQVIR